MIFLKHYLPGVAVAVLNRLLYAIGGFDGENRLRSTECYCPDSKKWSLVAPMNTPRSGAGSASLNGYVFLNGSVDDCILKTCVLYYLLFPSILKVILPSWAIDNNYNFDVICVAWTLETKKCKELRIGISFFLSFLQKIVCHRWL